MPLGERAEELLGVGARAGSRAESCVAVAAAREQQGQKEGERGGDAKMASAGGGTRVVGGRVQDWLREGRRTARRDARGVEGASSPGYFTRVPPDGQRSATIWRILVPLGVTGNTPDSGSGESWFDPRRGN
jgi:hypothetical protein